MASRTIVLRVARVVRITPTQSRDESSFRALDPPVGEAFKNFPQKSPRDGLPISCQRAVAMGKLGAFIMFRNGFL
jgi:hypothetical protein